MTSMNCPTNYHFYVSEIKKYCSNLKRSRIEHGVKFLFFILKKVKYLKDVRKNKTKKNQMLNNLFKNCPKSRSGFGENMVIP